MPTTIPRSLVLLLACAAIGLAGCPAAVAPPAAAVTTSKGTIGVSLMALDNPFFKVIGDTITAEGAKHGYKTIVVSGDKDVAKQSNQIKDFIVKQVAAIVLSPCDSKSIVPVIREANAAGIPVFTVDIPCNEPGVTIVTQVATDNEGGGREAGTAMIEALGEMGGPIAILHFKQAESCQLRVRGFRAVIDAHNATAARKIDIVTELESSGAKDVGYKAMEDALQAAPNLRGVFAINDPAALPSKKPASPSKSASSASTASPRESRPSATARSTPIRSSFPTAWACRSSMPSCAIRRGKHCRRRCSFPPGCTDRPMLALTQN